MTRSPLRIQEMKNPSTTLKLDIPTSQNYKGKSSNQNNISNNLSCFECGSHYHLIKDYPRAIQM